MNTQQLKIQAVKGLWLSLGLVGLVNIATADSYRSGHGYKHVNAVRYDYARVVNVEPIRERIRVDTPQRDCWQEEQTSYPQSTAHSAVTGAIIGGVIGHNVGSRRHRDVSTVAGAILGAAIGHDMGARNAAPQTRDVQRCTVRYQEVWQERVAAYRVTYMYGGERYTTQLGYDPGNRVRVRVGVEIAD